MNHDPRDRLEPVPPGGSPDPDLRVARHPDGPPPGLREAVLASTGAPMEPELSACLGLGSRLLGIPETRLRLGHGPSELLGALLSGILEPGGRVALAEPCLAGATEVILSAGGRYVDVGRTHSWEIHAGALERVLSDGDVSLVVLGRPGVPTGRLTPLTMVREALDRGVDVVVDESHLTWTHGPETSLLESSLRDHDHLWILRCAGRDWGLGDLGVGLLIGHEDRICRLPDVGPWDRAREAALLHLLETQPGLTPWGAELRGARDTLVEVIRRLPGLTVAGEDGPGILLGRPGWDGQRVQALLAQGGVLTACSEHWSHRGHVHIGAPGPRQLPRVEDALTALAAG